MMSWLILVSIVALILLLGYLRYGMLPKELANRRRMVMVLILIDIFRIRDSIVGMLTGKPRLIVSQERLLKHTGTIHQNYPQLKVENKTLNGTQVRLYTPRQLTGLSPGIVYIHGGGFIIGTLDYNEGVYIRLALQTNMTVVAVSYSKAPQHPYPVAFEECLRATTYVLQNGEELGIDSNKVAIGGDSAGGNLAAAVALKLSQDESTTNPPLRLQFLFVPTLQCLSFNTKSYLEAPRNILTRRTMTECYAAYLGLDLKSAETYSTLAQDRHVSLSVQRSVYSSYLDKVRAKVYHTYNEEMAKKLDKLVVDPYVSPLMADDLSKMPPAYIVAGQYDQLRDDAVMFSERLKSAGVKTDLWVLQDQPHIGLAFITFERMLPCEDYKEILDTVADHIKSVM